MTEPEENTEAIGARVRQTAQAVDAPPDLRLRVDAAHAQAARPVRHRSWRLGAGLAGVAAVAAVLALVVLPGSDPTAADAAAFALRTPARLAPVGPWKKDHRYVDQEVGGIWFPNYGYDTKWKAVGAHAGKVGDRRAVTVSYTDGTHRFAYTIVDGPPLAVSSSQAATATAGTKVAVLRDDGTAVITWRHKGHTCILASRTASVRQLLSAVDWRAA